MPSKFSLKVGANSFFAVLAAVVLILFFAENTRDDLLNNIRDFWITHRMGSLNEEALAALAREELDSNPDTLIRILKSSAWDQLRPGDRGYSLKQRMFVRLCTTLQERNDHEESVKWAGAWLALNDRDLDARAFWFEGIRHIPGREKEGLEGLISNYHDFPKNLYLRRFLAVAYLDQGEVEAAIKIARSMMSHVLSGWQVFWVTSDSDFFSESRSARVSLSRGMAMETTLQFDLPADTTSVRIDVPPKSHLRILDLQLRIGGEKQEIAFKEARLSQMRYEGGSLVAYGGDDPYFVLPVKIVGRANPDAKLPVVLHLEMMAVYLGHDFNVIDLFDEA